MCATVCILCYVFAGSLIALAPSCSAEHLPLDCGGQAVRGEGRGAGGGQGGGAERPRER